jgi:thiosulfate/3-mercaptopyruvate sulfurtransferase
MPPRLSRRALLAGVAGLGAASLLHAACGGGELSIVTPQTNAFPVRSMLADVASVAARLDDPRLRLIDCSPINVYRRGHIPGARHLWWQDTIEINNPVYGMLTSPETRRMLARRCGIDAGSDVVCYDNAGGVYAARVVWMLHSLSFFNVQLLDGGRQAWRAAGYRLTGATPEHGRGTVDGVPNEEVNAAAHDIVAWLGRSDLVILDTRTAEEREQTWYGRLRRGTIPGSWWLPRDMFHQPPGGYVLAAPDELTRRLAEAGVDASTREVIVYGLHSTLAALPWIALLALGMQHARVYNGSWAEWGADHSLPIVPLE